MENILQRDLIQKYLGDSIANLYSHAENENVFCDYVRKNPVPPVVIFKLLKFAGKKAISLNAKKAGGSIKKLNQRKKALDLWVGWIEKNSKYKNRTNFQNQLVSDGLCSEATSSRWVNLFRKEKPCEHLEQKFFLKKI